MVIKRDKEYRITMILCLIGIVVLGFIYTLGLNTSIWVFLALHSPLFLYIGLHAIAYGRTFIFSPEGCTVCFLWFRKTYYWNEFRTKKTEIYPHFTIVPAKGCPYKKYVMFAPFRVRKPTLIRPLFYNMIHPWSYIYINFYIPDPRKKGLLGKITYRGRHYEIHEDAFMDKLAQWNVELDDKTD